jgi:hypothetical protein
MTDLIHSYFMTALTSNLLITVRVTSRLAVYLQSVRLGVKPLETHDQKFFQLNTCGYSPYVTSSLTRGCVCRLQLLLVFASAFILRSESRGTHDPHDIFYRLKFETPQTWRTRSPYLYPQEQGDPVISPGTRFPFRRLLRLVGLRWSFWNPHPHGILLRSYLHSRLYSVAVS